MDEPTDHADTLNFYVAEKIFSVYFMLFISPGKCLMGNNFFKADLVMTEAYSFSDKTVQNKAKAKRKY